MFDPLTYHRFKVLNSSNMNYPAYQNFEIVSVLYWIIAYLKTFSVTCIVWLHPVLIANQRQRWLIRTWVCQTVISNRESYLFLTRFSTQTFHWFSRVAASKIRKSVPLVILEILRSNASFCKFVFSIDFGRALVLILFLLFQGWCSIYAVLAT